MKLKASFRREGGFFEKATIQADKDALVLGKTRIAAGDIARADYVQASRDEAEHVLIVTAEETIRIYTTSDRAGELLGALGFGATEIVGSFRVVAGWETTAAPASIVAIFLGCAACVVAVGWLTLLPLIATFMAMIAAFFLAQATVQIGADGFLYRTLLDRIFVPWSDVTEIEKTASGMLVHRMRGSLFVPATWGTRASPSIDESLAELVQRAREAWWASRRGKHAETEDRLARGDRTQEKWLKDISAREGDFRSAPLRDDDLWQVLEDPNARQTARAAAAVLLARSSGAPDRIRIAAAACAAPKVRIVLEAAARGDEPDVIEQALDEVSDA